MTATMAAAARERAKEPLLVLVVGATVGARVVLDAGVGGGA